MTDEPTEATVREARLALDKAIKQYYEVAKPGHYVSAWLLTTHRESAEMVNENRSALGTVVPDDQAFHVSLGLSVYASDLWRSGVRYND